MSKFYQNIDELPLYKFDKYLQTKDCNWFRKDYTGQEKQIKSSKLEELEFELLDQYYKAIDDKAFIEKLRKWGQIQYLRTKYNVCLTLIKAISVSFDFPETRLKYIKELAKHGYKIPEINHRIGELQELERVLQEIKGIFTKIHLLEKEIQEDSRKGSHSLQKQIKIIELNLGAKYGHQIRINPREISVLEWIEYVKELKEVAEQN